MLYTYASLTQLVKKKCRYCGHKPACDIRGVKDRALCDKVVTLYNDSQENARRVKQNEQKAKRP